MRREDFEHVIAAAAEAANEDEFIVVGSQAILGSHPEAPVTMLRSLEVDLYPRHRPEKSVEIDGSLGDGSQFHRSYGYYAHGVGPETAKPPAGWEGRLIRVPLAPRVAAKRAPVAYCLEAHDLVLAKCVAGRDRDWDFAREALQAGLVRSEELLRRSNDLPVAADHRARIRRTLEAIATKLDEG